MAVYAKNLSSEWKEAFETFERVSGFEILSQEEIDSGKMTAEEVWRLNQDWFELVYSEVQNISTPGL